MQTSRWLVFFAVLVSLAAPGCASDPPVEAIEPLRGPWGTKVTFHSSRMDELAAIAIGDLVVPRRDIVVTGELASFRVPWPARGPVRVTLGSDVYDAGSFEPTWETTDLVEASRVLAAQREGDRGVAAVLEARGGSLVFARWSAGEEPEATTFERPAPSDRITSARIAGDLVVAVTSAGALLELDARGRVIDTSLGFGRDAEIVALRSAPDGLHAWIRGTCSITLAVREAGWHIARGPISLRSAACRGAFAEADDGTLHAVLHETRGSFLADQVGVAYAMVLEPASETIVATLLEARDDAIVDARVLLAAGAPPVLVYCNDDTMPDEGTPSVCHSRTRRGGTYEPAPGVPLELPLGTHYARAKERVVAAKPHYTWFVLAEADAEGEWPTIMAGNVKVEDLFLGEAGEPLLLVHDLLAGGFSVARPRLKE